MIEVWEKLDCEDVGRAEIEAVEEAVRAEYGDDAVDPPMAIARFLADEGAYLRHSEIMQLYVDRAEDRPYDAAFRGIIDLKDLKSTLSSLKQLDNLRQKYLSDNDKTGIRLIRETVVAAKDDLVRRLDDPRLDDAARMIAIEAAEWLSHWLRTPDIFFDWLAIRQNTADFKERFGSLAA